MQSPFPFDHDTLIRDCHIAYLDALIQRMTAPDPARSTLPTPMRAVSDLLYRRGFALRTLPDSRIADFCGAFGATPVSLDVWFVPWPSDDRGIIDDTPSTRTRAALCERARAKLDALKEEARSALFPPGPYVLDGRHPGNVYCDDAAGTVIAFCVPQTDMRLVRYDGATVAGRIAACLNALDGVPDPVAFMQEIKDFLLKARVDSLAARINPLTPKED